MHAGTPGPALFELGNRWRETYPGASAGILVLRGVRNPSGEPSLEESKRGLEIELRARYAGFSRADLRALPVIRAYEAYYRRFGDTYHVLLQLESVVLKGKPLPHATTLVEAMFMAELSDLLLTAGHDLSTLALPVRIEIAEGHERYTLLNGREQTLKAGDMHMADGLGVISSVLYGPDVRTRITPETRDVLYAVYAPPGIEPEAVAVHLDRIEAYVRLAAPDARCELKAVYPAG
ncbi:hypothetical protein NET02_11620 [Thermomicrobiaceae bacterium CFH 74404]|uniref:B3/B4 tRNA-binding domain-containing protein n=1 Tax=Thermalbibacter longus TaxID=2951981 RepID=A0AA41WEW0_9BACT|nr:hypothetical protein [Thermalbibacter longus]MCM8749798.1 hypothetical protein [Thermalbibacter longus]